MIIQNYRRKARPSPKHETQSEEISYSQCLGVYPSVFRSGAPTACKNKLLLKGM